MEYSATEIIFFIIIAFSSGFVDSIAGGGGLITVPSLLMMNLSPLAALATTKFQASAGTAISVFYFSKKKLINLRKNWYFALSAFLFGVLGSSLISIIPNEHLKIITPILLIIVAFYIILTPSFSDIDKQPKITPLFYSLFITPFIAFYDGFFGPGAGSMYIVTLIFFLGYKSSGASANAKLLNLFSNLGATIFYLVTKSVLIKIGLIMIVFNILGNFVGARLVFLKGTKVIKPFIIIVSISICIKELLEII